MDDTLGPAGPLAGPAYEIPAAVGEIHGGNLFHSFAEFSLTRSESASFTGPRGIDNVIGRAAS